MPIEKLRAAKDLSDIAKLVGYKPKKLAYVLYKIADSDKYHTFEIPKTGGGVRIIEAPRPELKLIQSRLNLQLQACLVSVAIHQREAPSGEIAPGYAPGNVIAPDAGSEAPF